MTRIAIIALAALACATFMALRALSVWLGCDRWGEACSASFYYAFVGPFRFKWVYTYKELIAGVLAAAAGLSAIAAVRLQIAAGERTRVRDRADEARTAIRIIADDFTRATLSLTKESSKVPVNMQFARTAVAAFGRLSGGLSGMATQAIHAVELAAHEIAARERNSVRVDKLQGVSRPVDWEDVDERLIRAGKAMAITMRCYFSRADLFVTERAGFTYEKVDPNPLMIMMYKAGLTRDDVVMDSLFNWDKLTVFEPAAAPGDF